MRAETSILHWSAGGQAGDLGQNLVGEWVQVDNGRISFAFDWTGAAAPVGALSFEVSQDKTNPIPLPGAFVPGLAGPAGVADSSCADGIETTMRFIRPLYTRVGGGAGDTITCKVTRPL